MAFTADRPLLNPQFEGYKLSFSPSPHLAHIPLEHRATQSRTGVRAFGFQEVASRVRHNHLAVSESSDSAVYIADDGGVVLVRAVDEVNGDAQTRMTLHFVFQLPARATVPRGQTQYPEAAHVIHNLWLISDGHGCAYLLRMDMLPTNSEIIASVLATWQLQSDDTLVPFQLHTVALVEQGTACAVLSSSADTTSPSSSTTSQAIFNIWGVRFPVPEQPSEYDALQGATPTAFEISWRRRGDHIPLFVKYVPAQDAFLFLGGSSYQNISSTLQNPYEPTPDELAPIPRPDESLDTPAAPPYSWTQTDDAVTVAFAIPGATPKSSISATFVSHTLSLLVGNPRLAQPHYTAAPLWDTIHPATSLWTWERGEQNRAGLLTLHLDKAHPGTRWSHVFAQGFGAEVPETLDPSELAGIRESLDKYTATLQEGASGFGHEVPSLATGERDNEVDSNVGTSVVSTWVNADGGARIPTDDAPAVLLSLPLPGVPGPLTLIIKNDIDGPLYTLDDAHAWSHTATYPALAFVLASKRDTRFTFHISSTVAMAFDSGAREGGGGNVYLYRGSAPGDKWAKQSVFQIRPGVGALLGVGAVTTAAGRTSLLCLSEREMTVCHSLF